MAIVSRDADRNRHHYVGVDQRSAQRPALMWVVIKTWLTGHLLRLIGWGTAGVSVLTVLLGARQAGRNAERADQFKKIIEVKDAQLRAMLDAPRTRSELADRLRRGKF